jgi:hypothetical protein
MVELENGQPGKLDNFVIDLRKTEQHHASTFLSKQ